MCGCAFLRTVNNGLSVMLFLPSCFPSSPWTLFVGRGRSTRISIGEHFKTSFCLSLTCASSEIWGKARGADCDEPVTPPASGSRGDDASCISPATRATANTEAVRPFSVLTPAKVRLAPSGETASGSSGEADSIFDELESDDDRTSLLRSSHKQAASKGPRQSKGQPTLSSVAGDIRKIFLKERLEERPGGTQKERRGELYHGASKQRGEGADLSPRERTGKNPLAGIPQDLVDLFGKLRREARDLSRELAKRRRSCSLGAKPFFHPPRWWNPLLVAFQRHAAALSGCGGDVPAILSRRPLLGSRLQFSVLQLRSVSSGVTCTALVESVCPEEPLVLDVSIKALRYTLTAFPIYGDTGKVRKAVAAELQTLQTYKQLLEYFGCVGGTDLAGRFGLHLRTDVFAFDDESPAVELPGGLTVANYFVARIQLYGTLKKFAEEAAVLKAAQPAVVSAARVDVSMQVLELVVAYAGSGLHFTTLSVDSFEVDFYGIVYLRTWPPLLDTARGQVSEGLGSRLSKNKAKRGKSKVELPIPHGAVPHIVHVIAYVWCGGEAQKSAQAAAPLGDTYDSAREVLHRVQRDGQPLPAPLFALLGQLVSVERSSRLPLADIPKSSHWKELKMLRESAVAIRGL